MYGAAVRRRCWNSADCPASGSVYDKEPYAGYTCRQGVSVRATDNPSIINEAAQNIMGGTTAGNTANMLSYVTQFFNGQAIKQTATQVRGWFGGLAGPAVPITTRSSQEAGEIGTVPSSHIAAPFLARDMAGRVLETEPIPTSWVPFSRKTTCVQCGRDFSTPETAKRPRGFEPRGPRRVLRHGSGLSSRVVRSTRPGIHRATQADHRPGHGQSLQSGTGHRAERAASLTRTGHASPNQPQAHQRGRAGQDGARRATAGSAGNLTGTFKRKSPFGRKARGTGTLYDINYYNIIENTYAKQLELANYKRFIQSLQDSDLAVLGKPGQIGVTLGEQGTVGFPVQRRTLVLASEEQPARTIPQNQTLYVRADIAREFRTATDVDAPIRGKVLAPVNSVLNSAAITGLTDAVAHCTNLMTALLTRPGVGGDSIREGIPPQAVSATSRSSSTT